MKRPRIADAEDHVSVAAAERGTQLVPPETLLMVVRGMILAHTFPVAITTAPVTFNQDIKALRPRSDVDPWFLLPWLQTMQQEVLSRVEVSNHGTKRLPTERLFEMRLPLPPLAEQREIAATLKAVDDAIAAGEAMVEQLDRVRRDVTENLIRGDTSRTSGPKQSTGVVECPGSWRIATLDAVVASCDYGLSSPLSLDVAGVACLRMGNIQGGEVRLADLKYVSASQADPALLLNEGDVLFNRTNSKDLVGKVGVFRGCDRPITFASYLLRLRPRPDIAIGEWLGLVLGSESYQRHIRSMATPGASQVNVNRTKLLALRIPVPQLDVQRSLVDSVVAIAGSLDAERAVLHERRRLKAALAEGLLTGRIRVPETQTV